MNKPFSFQTSAKPMWVSSLILFVVTMLCLPFLNIEYTQTSPLHELKLMFYGFFQPDFIIDGLFDALLHTVAFALQAVIISAIVGFAFAQIYHIPGIKAFMTFLRSVHELFWALILIQLFGLSTLTGILALAIPYSATFARVFAEIQQETSQKLFQQLRGSYFSRLIYSTLPLAWPRLVTYSRYRLECALRSSVVLGFIGLPTLGFHLDGYLKTGAYSEVAALIILFIVMVMTMRFWTRRWPLLILFIASIIWLPPSTPGTYSFKFEQRLSQLVDDITPPPFRHYVNDEKDLPAAYSNYPHLLSEFSQWFVPLWKNQIVPGTGYTLLLGQFAFALSAFLALLWFPLISRPLIHTGIHRMPGHFFLTSLRCLPELLLAFIGLVILGPSLLPGILAIALHNGALLAHLVGQHSNELRFRKDISSGMNLYFYELLPRIYPQFMAFTLYRGETILRETAILGILGIPTLGFYIDSAFEEFRLDRALLLILVSAMINILAETIATYCRKTIHVQQQKISTAH